jgi:hypothetical protein
MPKRMEYEQATLRFGRRRLLVVEVFLGPQKERGGGRVVLDSVYGRHKHSVLFCVHKTKKSDSSSDHLICIFLAFFFVNIVGQIINNIVSFQN